MDPLTQFIDALFQAVFSFVIGFMQQILAAFLL